MSAVDTKAMRPVAAEALLWGAIAAGLFYLYGVSGNAQSTASQGHSAMLWMARRWSGSGGDMSHGWLIPLAAAYVVWRRREALRAAPRRACLWGAVLIAACLLLHWFGFRAQLTRLSLLSLIGLLWSIPLYFYGWAVARQLVFPCAYLLFCIPLSFLDGLTVPLRALMSSITTGLLNGLGIPAVRVGTTIESMAAGGFKFDVADPCSGLRSLLALSALTALYAALTQRGLLRQWLLFLAAVPAAVAGNVARILTVAIVAQLFGQELAGGFYHDYSGYIVFIVAVLAILGLGRLLRADMRGKWRDVMRRNATCAR